MNIDGVEDSGEDERDKVTTKEEDGEMNEKGNFIELLGANIIPEKPRQKRETKTRPDKKIIFSNEMLKGIQILDGKQDNIKTWYDYLDTAKLCFEQRLYSTDTAPVTKSDFQFLKTVGTGAFSKVLLIRSSDSKNYYAAKLLTKAALVRDKHVQHAHNEKLILQSIRFVFTIHLEYFFQDNVYLFFVLPLIAGGELFTYLTRVHRLKEDHARFYSAQMLLALEYLHFLGLIFRDLKPENILIDSAGYLKLADFGFCKAVDLRTYTFCGTVEYLAPEMINNRGYGKSVDWWTFGVLLYELCAGYTPFYSKMHSKTYESISRCKYKFPYHFSPDLRDLIKNILVIDLSRRYGNLKNGVEDIKGHKFFSKINWIMVLNREIKAPYIPTISRPDDTSNFEKYEERPLQTTSADLYYKEFAHF